MPELRFDKDVVLVTGAGGGLGRAYGLFFAERGARVVINDVSAKAGQAVVDEIKSRGGKAALNVSSVTDGQAVVQSALDAFGGLTILINNAGILRDKSFKNMSDAEFDLVVAVHLKGSFSCARAAWPIFKRQNYGRIINSTSAAGLYGNFGQANYAAVKSGLIAFTKTLAREGVKYNILSNVIAPMAKSAMTETIMPPEMLQHLSPEFVSPLVATLCAPAGTIPGPALNGRLFEVGAGYIGEVRWQRSSGVVFKPDGSFTPSAVRENWKLIRDFSKPIYETSMSDSDISAILKKAARSPTNKQSTQATRFDGQTIVITGAGAGLGRAYALMLARLGANVVINDVSEKAANSVVDEVENLGGKGLAVACSAEDGDQIFADAVKKFGTVHGLIANAGILRDKAFGNMTEKEWDDVIAVHLRGTYKCARAAFGVFLKQKFGRIVVTCSAVGLHGNFGQANYSAAKAAILGLGRTIAIEGARNGIQTNILVPTAGTAMTETIWPKETVHAFKPDFVAPIVGWLLHPDCDSNGAVFEVAGGSAAEVRWQRSGGHGFPTNTPLTPEAIISKWALLSNFNDGKATNPSSTSEAIQQIVENFTNTTDSGAIPSYPDTADKEDPASIQEAKKTKIEIINFDYSEKDCILYNLGLGATENNLNLVYEGSDDFQVLPTFGVVPQFATLLLVDFGKFLPNFSATKLLHGEQYLRLERRTGMPTRAKTSTSCQLKQVLDLGKSAAVTLATRTVNRDTGELLCENESTLILRGSGGFSGKKKGIDRGNATALNAIPKRRPDQVVAEKTDGKQAALYRQSGDLNPLHIDPQFAAMGGFSQPILHGLCTMGISAKHIANTYGEIKDIKVRFAGVVYPGETVETSMWSDSDRVIFITSVKERNTIVLAAAAATLWQASGPKAKL